MGRGAACLGFVLGQQDKAEGVTRAMSSRMVGLTLAAQLHTCLKNRQSGDKIPQEGCS